MTESIEVNALFNSGKTSQQWHTEWHILGDTINLVH